MTQIKKTAVLIIMDGFGLTNEAKGNAILAAKIPVLTALNGGKPLTDVHTKLGASSEAVGLPPDTMGNSEVGHTNLGAGRVVYQSLLRISNAIKDGSFFTNPVLADCAETAKQSGRAHLFALLGNAGVHSIDTHLHAAMELMKDVPEVYVHLFTDGRDTAPHSALKFCEETRLPPNAKIATLIGRFYAMDRDKRWERVERAYNALVNGAGTQTSNVLDAIRQSYDAGITDEFIEPIIVEPEGRIKKGDSVLFVNFRPDRAREITRTFVDPEFSGFAREYFPVEFTCMTQYDETLPNVKVAFAPEIPANTLGELLANLGKTQLRIAETEKYAHVTFFFNGGVEEPFSGEDRILIPSPKEFATYDLIPEMSAYKVTDALTEQIKSGKYDAIICNFANCDMVGHTGVFDAAVKAVETVDACVGKALAAVREIGGTVIVTADHGNAERMLLPDGSPQTAHTTNLVPLWVSGDERTLKTSGKLCDVAPTLLDLMGIEKPTEWSGHSLFEQ
ncbi:MAG: 2,3-bisphosphoglycerate-independent phosphoglycerate mutase [Oscillospiraceae bacterium]|jgi:2,3-bisphosphoglycerate-independent phosphoglycerate mutase|nr:2,3-bisphosphoglycerate-independent phosphoglycerate mutase [Oscillospiraceae bacterium]